MVSLQRRYRHTGGRFRLITILATIAVVLTSSCSSDDDAGTDPTNTESEIVSTRPDRIGVIELGSSVSTPTKIMRARFWQLAGGFDTALIDAIAEYELPAAGRCSIASEAPLETIGARSLDVGESIVFSSDAGTYATIERESDDGEFSYETAVSFDGSFPATLSLDVMDGGFQSTQGLSVPLAEGASTMVEPALRSRVFADTVYRWNPTTSTGGQSYIVLDINFTDDITNSVLCVLPDGAEFSLPEETLAVLRSRNEISFDNSIGSLRTLGTAVARVESSEESVVIIRHLHLSEGIR